VLDWENYTRQVILMSFLVSALGLFSLIVGSIGLIMAMYNESITSFLFALFGVLAGVYVLMKVD
tara:strand:+ start:152375 stop:152566 length:192 start_codon:yes stop_codon:yes gene_type:complete